MGNTAARDGHPLRATVVPLCSVHGGAPSTDRREPAQEQQQPHGRGAGKALEKRCRQLLHGYRRHECSASPTPEAGLGQHLAPPAPPAHHGMPAYPDKCMQIAHARRRRSAAHRRDQHHDRKRVYLRAKKAHRGRHAPLTTLPVRTAKAEALAIILAYPCRYTARLAGKVPDVQRRTAHPAAPPLLGGGHILIHPQQ